MSKKKKPFYKRVWFIIFILAAAAGCVHSYKAYVKSRIVWNDIELCGYLPKPNSDRGVILTNNSDRLSMHADKISKSDYTNYIEACDAMGFTVESEKNGNTYTAFNQNGYKINLSHINDTMYIELEAPEKLGSYTWPASEIAALLPIPESDIGKVISDSADNFCIYIGNTSLDHFGNYINKCIANGFSEDYQKGDKFYTANDKEGNRLSLAYRGNLVMSIKISKPEKVTDGYTAGTEAANAASSTAADPAANETKATEPAQNTAPANGLRTDFINAMDSYEAFMDEYCEFMKKYNASNGTDLQLLASYAEYMRKYADTVQAFDAWKDNDMNEAETAYFLEVQLRVNQKLLETTVSAQCSYSARIAQRSFVDLARGLDAHSCAEGRITSFAISL